jgi:hypothetical protein
MIFRREGWHDGKVARFTSSPEGVAEGEIENLEKVLARGDDDRVLLADVL